MSWISVKDELPESDEVEIAFWDGVLMCRTFGAYTENDWYCGSDKIETCGWKVTHWKEPTSLPDPPEQESMKYVNPDWFIVDGKWRHLMKVPKEDTIKFYCDGALEATIKISPEAK